MDAQRALLDSLMGLNRDGDRPDDDACMDFRHPRVCKLYLCGLCPRALFQNTRLDAGACELLHLPTLRSAYEEQKSKEDFGYERKLASELSKLLADVEKKIARAQRRLAEDGSESQDQKQILQLTQDMQEAVVQSEQAARSGDVELSLRCVEKVELLKQKRREALRQITAGSFNVVDTVNQKLRVCDVCGAFLSIFDSERRLADHFGGKLHVGYVQIRRKLKELAEKKSNIQQVERRPIQGLRSRPRIREEQHRIKRPERESREPRKKRSRSRARQPNKRSRDHGSKFRRSISTSWSRSRSPERRQRRNYRHRR